MHVCNAMQLACGADIVLPDAMAHKFELLRLGSREFIIQLGLRFQASDQNASLAIKTRSAEAFVALQVLVTGSLYLVGDVLKLLNKAPI